MRRALEFTLALVLFSALSAAWSWPLVSDPWGLDIALQMDSPNTLGLAAAVAEASDPLHPERLAWPWGQSLVRGDSFVYFLLARLLAGFPPTTPLALCILVGPVISALAAESVSRRLGAAFPWSLLAGVAYGYSGLQATAVLEGYGFNLLNPWLPWMVGAALAACGPTGRLRDAGLAAAMWSLCVLTSAYAGIGASLLLVVLVGGALLRHRSVSRATALLAVLVLILGLGWTAFFLSAPEDGRRHVPDLETSKGMMRTGSANLGTLLWRTPSVDLAMHSQGVLLSSLALALAVLGVVLCPPEGSRRLLAGGIGLVLISMGNELSLWATDRGFVWLLAPLAELGAGAYFRFPERMVHPASLAFALLAARCLTQIAQSRRVGASLLLIAGLAEALWLVGLPARVGHREWAAPSAYASAPQGRAVLDLWPRFFGRNDVHETRLTRRSIGYSAMHGRPVFSNALNVSNAEDGRAPVGDWLLTRARSERQADDPQTRAELQALGVGAVAVHMDLFTASQQAELSAGLERLFGPTTARSSDHGERIWLWTVSEAPLQGSREDRVAVWKRLQAEVR